jgi:large subunit ribosomal protein L9
VAQAILLKDVEDLGAAGDAVDVSPGYLRNYLVPRKLAQPATDASLEEAQRRREAAERAAQEAADRAEETAALLAKTVLTIQHRAGEDGKLFGSVTSAEIADAIQAARGIKVDRKKIRLEEPIRETGTYMVEVEVGGGVTASVKTIVAEMREGPEA